MSDPAVPASFGSTVGLCADTGSGVPVDDPSPAQLAGLVGAVAGGAAPFLVVRRRADASGETYVQIVAMGEFLVERRDGGPDRHFSTMVPDADAVMAYLAAWTAGDSDAGLAWDRMQF